MPYAAVERPSIGLGLLKASLQEADVESVVLYPNLWFAEEIGLDVYKGISGGFLELFFGEWTFSGAAFPDFHPAHDEYFRLIKQKLGKRLQQHIPKSTSYRSFFWQIREKATTFIDRVALSVLDLQPKIVACSSTFHQHCASLALLRRIRELAPEVITLMGGANCEGEMGLATKREFSWVDFVVSGEGDELMGPLCHLLLKQGRQVDPSSLPYGVISSHSYGQAQGETIVAPRTSVRDLNQIPIPDYDDYFQALATSPLASYIKPGLLVETSRGCWWGQIHHCTFCGLNGSSMGYRSKSPERVLQELTYLAQRYGLHQFEAVDNILDMSYLETLLPHLAALPEPYSFFYETKANLTYNQLQKLVDAGVNSIQPGIESMHNSILKLIDKGTTAWMNVQLLKWAQELGIYVYWNFLVGIPRESDTWYTEMAEWLPLIVHLQPPASVIKIQYHRFSPYHQRPAEFDLTLVPSQFYRYIYPLSSESLTNLVYYFEDVSNSTESKAGKTIDVFNRSGLAALDICLRKWTFLYHCPGTPVLEMIDEGEQIRIRDTRPCAIEPEQVISGLAYWVYIACDRALSQQGLYKELLQKGVATLTDGHIFQYKDKYCYVKASNS
jgi:magnesium-protoporphyrin IX monomethyl ester (oxidative) cyclase